MTLEELRERKIEDIARECEMGAYIGTSFILDRRVVEFGKKVAAAFADEARRCAADVCGLCSNTEWTEARRNDNGGWLHAYKPREASVSTCKASAIHERLHRESQKGGNHEKAET